MEIGIGPVTALQVLLVVSGSIVDRVVILLAQFRKGIDFTAVILIKSRKPDRITAEDAVLHRGYIMGCKQQLRPVPVDLRIGEETNYISEKLRMQLGIQFVYDYETAFLQRHQDDG